MADTPEHDVYSQHVNALAILAEVLEEHEAQEVCRKMLDDTTLIQATFYFRYFVQQAMDKVGMANRLLDTLQPWRDQLAIGLTTWAENPEPSRSDCHAWSAHLNIEFYRMLLGIHSAAPGFAKVRLTPALGHLSEASGSIPHPLGSISIAYLKTGQTLHARIVLPEGVHATLEWKGQCVEVEHSQELVIAE